MKKLIFLYLLLLSIPLLSQNQGCVMYSDSVGSRLSVLPLSYGHSGYILQSNGVRAIPSWVAPSGGAFTAYPPQGYIAYGSLSPDSMSYEKNGNFFYNPFAEGGPLFYVGASQAYDTSGLAMYLQINGINNSENTFQLTNKNNVIIKYDAFNGQDNYLQLTPGNTSTGLTLWSNDTGTNYDYSTPSFRIGGIKTKFPTSQSTTGQVLTATSPGVTAWVSPTGLSGSGTVNTIPIFTGTSTIGNSLITFPGIYSPSFGDYTLTAIGGTAFEIDSTATLYLVNKPKYSNQTGSDFTQINGEDSTLILQMTGKARTGYFRFTNKCNGQGVNLITPRLASSEIEDTIQNQNGTAGLMNNGFDVQSGTSYTIPMSDFRIQTIVEFTSTTSVTVTLPSISSIPIGYPITLKCSKIGAAQTMTLLPSGGGETIDNTSSIAILIISSIQPSATIEKDPSGNWIILSSN